jgi:hypothetical protein
MAERAATAGVYDHCGWAVVVCVSTDNEVLDSRRIELVESGPSPQPTVRRPYFIAFGGTQRKNLERIVAAFAASRSVADAELHIVGPPEKRLDLIRKAGLCTAPWAPDGGHRKLGSKDIAV